MPEFNTWFPDVHLPGQGLKIYGTNVTSIVDPTYQTTMDLNITQDGSNLIPGFTNSSVFSIQGFSNATGHNSYRIGPADGETTTFKHSWLPFFIKTFYQGAGQRIAAAINQTAYGMGDSALLNLSNIYYGGPTAGDEGQGFSHVCYLAQGSALQTGPIEAVPAKSTLSTTTTQVIVASKDPQTVTVASSAGAAVGDWLIIEQLVVTGGDVLEPVKLTAVGSGTISGIFRNNHPTGVKVRPATLLQISGGIAFGQDRVIVNLDGASYTTGTITSHGEVGVPGSTAPYLNGTGTGWSAGMVGGDADNIGAICIINEIYTGYPFTGLNPLRSWHQITQITSPTQLAFHSLSVAGDAGYKGPADWPSAYVVRPAVRLLRFSVEENLCVCEYSTHTWTVGDEAECAICPYPDVTGFQYALEQWTPGGTLRSFMDIKNRGARTYETCIYINTNMPNPAGNNADDTGFNTGVHISGCRTGLRVGWSGYQTDMDCAIACDAAAIYGYPTDNGTKISLGMGFLRANSPHVGLDIQGTAGGAGGLLSFIASDTMVSETLARMDFTGSLRLHGCLDVVERDVGIGSGPVPAPAVAANIARIFAQDNGSGKTQLMVQFPSGTAVQLAIEPP